MQSNREEKIAIRVAWGFVIAICLLTVGVSLFSHNPTSSQVDYCATVEKGGPINPDLLDYIESCKNSPIDGNREILCYNTKKRLEPDIRIAETRQAFVDSLGTPMHQTSAEKGLRFSLTETFTAIEEEISESCSTNTPTTTPSEVSGEILTPVTKITDTPNLTPTPTDGSITNGSKRTSTRFANTSTTTAVISPTRIQSTSTSISMPMTKRPLSPSPRPTRDSLSPMATNGEARVATTSTRLSSEINSPTSVNSPTAIKIPLIVVVQTSTPTPTSVAPLLSPTATNTTKITPSSESINDFSRRGLENFAVWLALVAGILTSLTLIIGAIARFTNLFSKEKK